MATILVTDGEQRAALATVRALGRSGYRVVVTSTSGRSLAGASRFTAVEHATPDPLRDRHGFVDRLAQLEQHYGFELMLPIAEGSLLAVLGSAERFEARIPFPDLKTVRRVLDKELITRLAPQFDIGVPRQVVVEHHTDLLHLELDGLTFPVVIKPARSVVESHRHRRKLSVQHAADRTALTRALGQLPAEAFPILLQQRIVGPGVGVFLLLGETAVLAQFAHRRLREKPPSGGVSVYRESVPLDPGMLDRSEALLRSLGWTGVAMVEYKMDALSGRAYLMEINGRLWGSLQLAIDAGVDFPVQLVRWGLGEPVTPTLSYRLGVRSRWWWGDVDHMLARFRRSDVANDLPPEAPTRLQALAAFLRVWWPGDRSEVLRRSDPKPFVWETMTWLRRS